jgi:NADPH:quinone reductase-like Zn-dependent oxidoreductase
MKAIRISKHGGHDVVSIDDIPEPSPNQGEVKIKIKITALNHLDIWVRNGMPGIPALPLILGCDGSGEVIETKSQNFKNGDRVFLVPLYGCGKCGACENKKINECPHFEIPGEHRHGVHAEFVCVPDTHAIKLSDRLTFEEGAGFPLASFTAWHMLVEKAKLRTKENVLIIGASSGIGSFAVQIAKHFGATVIATASGEKKQKFVHDLGADYIIDHYKENIAERVKEITNKKGIDVIFEHVGRAVWQDCLRSLARCGRLVTCGATSGPIVSIELRHLFIKQLQILGSTMGTKEELIRIHRLLSEGKLKSPIGKIFPFTEVKKAYEFLEDSKNTDHVGKVVLKWD